jgi:hypothetical protein
MRWTIVDQPWHVSAKHHIPVGDVIEAITRGGKLIGFRWNGETLPVVSTALPLNACACDQDAADELSRQHPERLFMLRATPPAVIRQLVTI